jgi:quercetin dioxygenase-like cupin family protein
VEIFKMSDYADRPNATANERMTIQLLEKKAESMVGMCIVLPPGGSTPYHYHDKRESVLIVISGKAKELVEGKRLPIEKGDILFIPAKEKHGVLNDSGAEFRFIEFQAGDPAVPDRVEVEWRES